MKYNVKKREFKKEDFVFLKVIFDNGDCVPISKTEIVDISLRLYDNLILGRDYWNTYCAVIESGFLKLKLQKKAKGVYSNPYLYNLKAYKRDRIEFIKNRLCNEGGVNSIKLYNDNNWSFTLYCKVETILDGDNLMLKFIPHKNAPYNSDTHNILLPEIDKSVISRLQLDFENCEGIYINQTEIVDMQINLSEQLNWGPEDYIRQIESGFLKIKLDSEFNDWRENNLFENFSRGIKGNRQIGKRLCGNKGFELHDICHLYIEYNYDNSGFNKRECIEIDDIRNQQELLKIEELKVKEGREIAPYFLGGYAEKIDKDTFLITFGKTALKDQRCQRELKKCSVLTNKKI